MLLPFSILWFQKLQRGSVIGKVPIFHKGEESLGFRHHLWFPLSSESLFKIPDQMIMIMCGFSRSDNNDNVWISYGQGWKLVRDHLNEGWGPGNLASKNIPK